jgi:hypothetical protein
MIGSKHFIGAVAISIALPVVWYGSQYNLYGRRFLDEHFSFVASKISGKVDLPDRELVLCQTVNGPGLTVTLPTDAPTRSGAGRRLGQIALGVAEYPRLLLLHYWPWLPLMLIGLTWQLRSLIRSRDSAAALLIIWVACVLIPFSVSEAKTLRYVMPIFPAFAILAAAPLSRWAGSIRAARYVKLGYLFALTALLLAALLPNPRYRADDMQALAPVIDANSDPARRVILYTYGELHHNYMSQFVWYTDRDCAHLTDLNTVKTALFSCPGQVAVVDKQAFAQLSGAPGISVVSLGESEKFVCVKSK